MSSLRALVAWLVALLLAGGALALGPGGAQAQEKRASPDASITTQVERIISSDHSLKRMQIRVETSRGVVQLTGFVRSVGDITRAGNLARAVSGVSGVNNRLQVENRSSRA